MATQFAPPQQLDLSPINPRLVQSFFQPSPTHHAHHRSPFGSPDAIRKTKKAVRKTSPAPSLASPPADVFLLDKTPLSRKSIILCQKEVSFELDHSPLPHKSSFFDLRKDEDVDMESDSTSTSSMFSDADEEEDYDDLTPKFKLRPTPSNASLYSSCTTDLDSYFAIPTDTLPSKSSTQQPMKSLANASLLLNQPQLTPQAPAVYNKPPIKAWGMPSFGPTHTPAFPRHCKVRRTQSMFEHPEDLIAVDAKLEMSSSPADTCPSILSREDCPIKSFTIEEDPFRRIDRDTLCEIMDGQHGSWYDRYMIVDCRFEYEYEGGHINGAININSKEGLEKVLLDTAGSDRVLLVFHCEYSAHRGPRMAMQLRNLDRQANQNRYPMLHYPDIAILDGGYSHFFAEHTARCYPQQYVEMNNQLHAEACEKEMDRFKRTMRFSRTQSFTYGAMAESPMAGKLSYSPCSPVARTKSMFSSFKFPPQQDSMNSSPSSNFSTPSLSTPTSFRSICIPSNDTTPTQPANRRRLGVLPKFAKSSLFSS